MWALSRFDVSGDNDTTGDTLHGGNGNDTFHTRDGEQDTIDCGDGLDVVFVDSTDVVAPTCEDVRV